METILKFNKEDSVELAQAMNGPNLTYILFDLDQWLRNLIKHTDKKEILIDEVREKLRELMGERGLTFDDKIFT